MTVPSEDITFCGFNCPNTKCDRNNKNIKQYWLDHSYAYFTECEEYKQGRANEGRANESEVGL